MAIKANFEELDQATSDLTSTVTEVETVDEAAATAIKGLIENQATATAAAVEEALDADNAANNTSIAAAKDAILQVKTRMLASVSKLAAAIPAGTPAEGGGTGGTGSGGGTGDGGGLPIPEPPAQP